VFIQIQMPTIMSALCQKLHKDAFMTTLAYRRDIDGLRALAIVPVVLYHFGFPGFSGGFVGVDVFFVISGFLITSIIWRERQAGAFSFVDFWARRARRILPPVFVMMAAVLVAGWLWLTPEDYQELGRATRYQAFFGSNFLYMRGQGYFAPVAQVQPLLHTWSLAVEEQFYLVFPLLLVLLSSRLQRWRLALLGMAVASFVLSQWALPRHEQAAFYMLPMRAWELLVGALLAVLPASTTLRPKVYELVSGAGLLAIVAAVCLYTEKTPFPGAAALLPTLGAGALIWANGRHRTLAGRLLGLPLLVGIGLISYSWYLWHWPLIVFGNYVSFDALTWVQRGGLLLASVALACASWRWVEGPFRQRRWLAGRKSLLIAALAGIFVFIGLGRSLWVAEGVPGRLSEQGQRYAAAGLWKAGQYDCLYDRHALSEQSLCHFGPAQPARAMLWGDSHAAALMPAWRAQAEQSGASVALAGHSACPPIDGLGREPSCETFNREARRLLAQPQISDVVLVAHWTLYTQGEDDGRTDLMIRRPGSTGIDVAYAQERLAAGLQATVAQLRAAGKRVWLVKEVPDQRVAIADRLVRLSMLGQPTAGYGRPLSERDRRQAFVDQLFQHMSAKDDQVRVLDPTPLFCPDQDTCLAEDQGQALYRDTNHLSDQGALRSMSLFNFLQTVTDQK
jgi:peptidoglycan/LPS O-acetylase OafA/YrhL